MRAPVLLLVLASAATPAGAQPPTAATTASAAAPAPAPDEATQLRTQVAQLQGQLAAAGIEIRRLRDIAATATAARAALDTCVAKNVRLVRIGNAMLTAYDRRYHRGHFGPLELGRTRFENEAQGYAGEIYDNKYDVPVTRQDAPSPTTATKAK